MTSGKRTWFNPFHPKFREDPYPSYHRLRVEEPVHWDPMGYWYLTRYADVVSVLRDGRFSVDYRNWEKHEARFRGRETGARTDVVEWFAFLHDAAREMRPPGLVIEHGLHPFIAYFVIPLFALFNAGVPLEGGGLSSVLNPVGLGVLLGLVLGKQIGVTFFSWLAVRFGWASLPEGVSWRMLYGVSWLAGVGFTMSLFVTELAFTDEYLINEAKLGILLASLVAGVVGLILLRLWLPTLARIDAPAPRSAQEVLQ